MGYPIFETGSSLFRVANAVPNKLKYHVIGPKVWSYKMSPKLKIRDNNLGLTDFPSHQLQQDVLNARKTR